MELGLTLQDSSSKLMLSLANDLIAFSQLKNGKFRKTQDWHDIRECLKEVVSIQMYKAKDKNIKIEVSVDQIDPSQLVFTDSYRLQ